MEKLRAVLIWTNRNECWFGFTTDPLHAENMELEKPRICLRYGEDCKGIIGLAVSGPTPNCRVGPIAEKAFIRGIEWAVDVVNEDAIKAWDMGYWK